MAHLFCHPCTAATGAATAAGATATVSAPPGTAGAIAAAATGGEVAARGPGLPMVTFSKKKAKLLLLSN